MADRSRWGEGRGRGAYGDDDRPRRIFGDYGRDRDSRWTRGEDERDRRWGEQRSFGGDRDERGYGVGGQRHGGQDDQRRGYGVGGYGGASSDYGAPAYGRDERERAYQRDERRAIEDYGDEDDLGREQDRPWTGAQALPGRHRGRGPKGYVRSDDRIREDVSDRMADDSWLDASEIEVTVKACEVVLAGSVASREDKRRAEDLAENVSGVKHVQNNLRVRQAGPFRSDASPAGRGDGGKSA